MKTKTCSTCKEDKPLDEYSFKSKSEGIRAAQCKNCHNIRSREWYRNNKARHIQKTSDNRRIVAKERQKVIWEFLKKSECVDCRIKDPLVLEFDHVHGSKEFSIGRAPQQRVPIQKLKEEMAKCVVRCANCHRRRHILEDQTWKAEMLELES